MDNLDAKGICAIINACHKAGVKELKLGDMSVSFVQESSQVAPWTGQASLTPIPTGTEIPTEELQPQTLVTSEQKEMLRQIEENQLMIDDPIAFEARMIDSETHYPRQPVPGEVEDMNA